MSVQRFFLAGAVLFAVLFGGFGTATEDLRVAVLDFQNQTGQPELNYLEAAIPSVLITDLSICEQLTLVERARLQEILDEMQLALSGVVNDEQATEIGELAGADAILVGSITAGGQVFRIDGRLVDVASGQVILAEKRSWLSDDEILLAVDELAEQIICKLTGVETGVSGDFVYEPLGVVEDHVLKMETALDQPVWLNGSGEAVFLQVDIYSKEVPVRERIPLNLALVIDRSGSMASARKLDYARQSAKFILENLAKDDIISIVTYGSKVQLVVPAQKAAAKRKTIQLIDEITAGGATNLSGGMLEGFSQVAKNLKTGQVNRVLLLSDGLANEGITRADKLSEICYEKSLQGMSISTFGVGADYDEDLLLGLAELGVGNYYYIYSPEEIPTIFAYEMSGLLAVAAQNVKIRVQTPANIKVVDIPGYLWETRNNETEVALGDIFSNDHFSLTLELQLPQAIPDSLCLADVVLQYDDVVNKGERITANTPVYIRATDEPDQREYYRNPYVGERLTLLNTTRQLQTIVQQADQSNLADVRQSLAKQAVQVADLARQYKSTDLKKQILTIHKYEQQFAAAEKEALELNKYSTAGRAGSSKENLETLKKAAKYDAYQVQKKNEVTPVIHKPKVVKTGTENRKTPSEPQPDSPAPAPEPLPVPVYKPLDNLQIQRGTAAESGKVETQKQQEDIKPAPVPDKPTKKPESKPQKEASKTPKIRKPVKETKPKTTEPKTEPTKEVPSEKPVEKPVDPKDVKRRK